MISAPAGSGGGGAPSTSGVAGANLGGAGTSGGGGGTGLSATGGSTSAAGTGGTLGEIAGGAGIAGATGGSTSTAGTGGTVGGVPPGWLVVEDVDYSKVPGPNFETVRLMFKAAQCSGSSCHYGGRNHFQMGKPADELYKYMLNFKTLECGKLIDTTKPSESAIVKYLRGPCGPIERMPSNKCFDDTDELCVPEYYIQAIEQWIANGAPR
ncbi:MAG: hypothetical protein WDO74_32660 [Pseudomonadota bacterium]